MVGRDGLPPVLRETSIGAGSLRGEVLLVTRLPDGFDVAARVTGGPDRVARVTDALECPVFAVWSDGNGCSVYSTCLRGMAVVDVDICQKVNASTSSTRARK
jgi:hypothetical protein